MNLYLCQSQRDRLPAIAASKRFNIINLTGDLVFYSATLIGDFERPVPTPHSIPPGGSYNFQVEYFSGKSLIAVARYKAVNSIGEDVGTAGMRMEVTAGGRSILTVSITGQLTSYQESSTVYVYRKY